MAVVYDAVGAVGGDAGAPVSSFSPGLPAGLGTGKTMVLVVACRATQTINTPSGWTARTLPVGVTGTGVAADTRLYVFDREWQSGDTAPTVTPSGSTRGAAVILSVDDDTSSSAPVYDTANSQTNDATGTWVAPAVTPAIDSTLLLCIYGMTADRQMVDNVPSGMTFIIETNVTRESGIYRQSLGAGTGGVSTGTRSITLGGTDSAVGALVVYKAGVQAHTDTKTDALGLVDSVSASHTLGAGIVVAATGMVGGDGGTTASSLSPGLPTGLAAGHTMVLLVGVRGAQSVNTPPGWSPRSLPVVFTASTNAGARLAVFDRVWQSGDTAPVVTFSADTRGAAVILALDDQASVSAPVLDVSNSAVGTGGTWTAPAVTPTADNTLLLVAYVLEAERDMAGNVPAGMTFVVETNSIRDLGVHRQTLGGGTAGVSTGARTVTPGATDACLGAQLVYRAAQGEDHTRNSTDNLGLLDAFGSSNYLGGMNTGLGTTAVVQQERTESGSLTDPLSQTTNHVRILDRIITYPPTG